MLLTVGGQQGRKGDEVGVGEEPSLWSRPSRAVQKGWTTGTVQLGRVTDPLLQMEVDHMDGCYQDGKRTEKGRTDSIWGVIMLHIRLKSGGTSL